MKKVSLSFHFLAFWFLVSPAFSQGLMPPKASTETAHQEAAAGFTIGSKISPKYSVIDEKGHARMLLSYKGALEILAMGFFGADCAENDKAFKTFMRLHQDYHEWKVVFVTVNSSADSAIPLIQNPDRSLSTAFHVSAVPAIVLLDEGGYVRYRGPLGKEARKAIETIIGHVDTVAQPDIPVTSNCSL